MQIKYAKICNNMDSICINMQQNTQKYAMKYAKYAEVHILHILHTYHNICTPHFSDGSATVP